MENLMKSMIAKLLWETQAVKINVEEPFKLASGNFSPIYINCRSLISHPVAMDLISAAIHWWYVEKKIEADVIAGGETAGIPFAAYVAQKLAKPMVYVRKQPKGYGMGSSVEGLIEKGQRVLLIEDLITDGGSKEVFIKGLKKEKAVVKHCMVVFDRQQGGEAFLRKKGVTLHALCTMEIIMKSLTQSGVISREQMKELQLYLGNPESWHKKRNIKFVKK